MVEPSAGTAGGALARRLTTVLPAFLVYLLHTLLFAGWIDDDAGISFAYARSLASGWGLVSQPGATPVEGFSNPLWVLLLAPFQRLGLLDPTWTPKLLSVALVGLAFLLLDAALARLGAGRLVCATALCLLAISTPFAVWTVSGLENPLYAALLALLLWSSARQVAPRPGERPSGWAPLAAGAVAAGVALTRPDGILFAAVYPSLVLLPRRRTVAAAEPMPGPAPAPAPGRLRRLRRLLLYGLAFALLFGGYLAFRLSYFGDLYPNTYHAKSGPSAGDLAALLTLQPQPVIKALRLMSGAAGRGGGLLAAALLAATAGLAGARRLGRRHAVLLAFLAAAVADFLLLPSDWMAELRFATPFFLFLWAYAALLAADLGAALLADPGRRRLAAAVAAALAIGAGLAVFAGRSLLFAAEPVVPFDQIEHDDGRRFNDYADRLGLAHGSILLPDLGGTLWVSRLRVFDLAGLCDRTIARTLGKDPEAFYDYVFETVQPTFIHTHEYWTLIAALDTDPRFRRDYVALREELEPWVAERARRRLYSGDFLRRSLAEQHPETVREIQAELAAAPALREGARAGPPG